jgi:hypothetical protein
VPPPSARAQAARHWQVRNWMSSMKNSKVEPGRIFQLSE